MLCLKTGALTSGKHGPFKWPGNKNQPAARRPMKRRSGSAGKTITPPYTCHDASHPGTNKAAFLLRELSRKNFRWKGNEKPGPGAAVVSFLRVAAFVGL